MTQFVQRSTGVDPTGRGTTRRDAMHCALLTVGAALLAIGAAVAQVLPPPSLARPTPGTVQPGEYPKLQMSLQRAPAGAPNVVIVLLDDEIGRAHV